MPFRLVFALTFCPAGERNANGGTDDGEKDYSFDEWEEVHRSRVVPGMCASCSWQTSKFRSFVFRHVAVRQQAW